VDGPIYARESGNVLVVLAVPLLFVYGNRTAVSIAFGVGKHKKSAVWAISEGIANLTLSVTLVHWFGIYGVAFGTMIPSLYFQLVVWPRYVYELVGIRASAVVRDVWAPMFLAATPFALVSYAVNRYMPTDRIAVFALQTLAILPVFIGALMLTFPEPMSDYVLPRVRSFVLSRTRDM
jgi:peptidoglycan biosynthesis protein MviN/MurJ (putative lipid II flippase)